MSISKYIVLNAKSQSEYIQHLEQLLLEEESNYTRCACCGRVDYTDNMRPMDDCGTYTCSQACERELNEKLEHEAEIYNRDREKNYQWLRHGR